MRKFFYAAVIGLAAVAASSETASAASAPWSWHHGVPVYSGRHNVERGGGYDVDRSGGHDVSGRRFRFSRRWRSAQTAPSTSWTWHHGVPVMAR